MIKKYSNFLILQLVVLIFGLTGPLGKAISAKEDIVVFYRLLFGILGIAAFFILTKISFRPSKKELRNTIPIGIIVGLHWLTFFGSIEASNVSIALICFSSSTLFSAILEPIYFRRKFVWYELILGIAIMIGLYFLVKKPGQNFFQAEFAMGMILSVISAFLASWFTVWNGTLIKQGMDAKRVSFQSLVFALIPTIIYVLWNNQGMLIEKLSITANDTVLLIILGLLCTSFAYLASIVVMKEISPFSVTMSVMLEPIYSILLAIWWFPNSERMETSFYIGAACIIGAIVSNAILKSSGRKKAISSTLQ